MDGFQSRRVVWGNDLGSNVLEAVLLWALKQRRQSSPTRDPLDGKFLNQLINAARQEDLISEDAAKQAHLAQEARRLTHPGKASRSGVSVSKATALTALAAAQVIIEELGRTLDL